MAANLQRRGLVSVGKRFVEANRTALPRDPTPFSASWRGVHLSTYDKNVEEEVRPSMVPDSAIDPELDKYWAPNPKTGVFGPADDSGGGGEELTPPADGSVLEEKAWFRPSEDVEKPPPPLTLE